MHLYTILLTKATLVVQNAIQADKGVALHREELEQELEGGTYDVINISAKHGSQSQLSTFCTGQYFPVSYTRSVVADLR